MPGWLLAARLASTAGPGEVLISEATFNAAQMETGKLEKRLYTRSERAYKMAFLPDGKLIIAGGRPGQEGNVRVYYWIDRKLGYALSTSDISKDDLLKVSNAVYQQLNP